MSSATNHPTIFYREKNRRRLHRTDFENSYIIYWHAIILLLKANRKPINEILKMSEREISDYLRETDDTLGPTDSTKVIPFEHGIKVLFFHKNQEKPFKTRVYLNIDNPDVLK